MTFFRKNKPAVDEAQAAPKGAMANRVREEMGLPVDPDAPWVLAARQHDDRFLRMGAQVSNWQRISLVLVVTVMLAIGGVIYMASLPRVEPVFIAVDKLNRTSPLSVGVADNAKVDMEGLIHREMTDFIENVRTVTSDYSANNKALTRAFSRLEGAGLNYVKTDLSTHKPNEVAQDKTIVVEIKLAFPITNAGQRNSWQVEWVETSYSLAGVQQGAPEMWKANIQYELRPSKTRKGVGANPIGFTIPALSWGKLS